MIPNGTFANGMQGFTTIFGDGGVTLSAAPLAGGKVFANEANVEVSVASDARIPVNRHWTYEVRGSFRRTTLLGTFGSINLMVRLFDANGAEISGDGAQWFWVMTYDRLLDTNWHTYSAKFGSGTAQPIPANARTMSLLANMNHNDGINPGNYTYEVTGLQIAPASRPPIHVFDTSLCPRTSTTAGVTVLMATPSFTLDRAATVTVTANTISRALGRRDVELRLDGTVMARQLVRTEVNDWAPHQLHWTGALAPGPHTFDLRAGTTLGATDGYGCGSDFGGMTVLFND